MGSRGNSHGQGSSTAWKESAFGACLGYHMKLEATFLNGLSRPAPYFHLDLNAGSGFNHDRNVVGTPELFLKQVRRWKDIPVRAWFIEKNRARAGQLRERIVGSGLLNGDLFGSQRYLDVVCENNSQSLEAFSRDVSRYDRPDCARGSIISDANGWSEREGALNLQQAVSALRALPHMMLLVSFFWSRAKAMHGYVARGENGPIKNVALRRVSDYLPLRPYWLISEPAGQWCYLCGTIRPYPEWERPGDGWKLVRLDSQRGAELLRHYDVIQSEAEVA